MCQQYICPGGPLWLHCPGSFPSRASPGHSCLYRACGALPRASAPRGCAANLQEAGSSRSALREGVSFARRCTSLHRKAKPGTGLWEGLSRASKTQPQIYPDANFPTVDRPCSKTARAPRSRVDKHAQNVPCRLCRPAVLGHLFLKE